MNNQDEIRINLPARHKYLNVSGACINALLDHVEGLSEREQLAMGIELAVYEVCTNVINYAYGELPGRIDLSFRLMETPRRLEIDIHDTGQSFVLGEIRPPNIDEVQTRGYGLFLIHQLMDKVSYLPVEGNNSWRLVKNL